MEQEKKDQRVTIMMSEKELAAVDTWAHDNRIKSRGEAVRLLINSAFSLIRAAKDVSEAYSRMEGGADYSEDQPDHLGWELRNAISTINGTLWMIMRNTDLQSSAEPALPSDLPGAQTKTEMLVVLDILDSLVKSYDSKGETSPMEDEVISMLERGKSNSDICDALGISDRLGKTYIDLIRRKVGAGIQEEIADNATISLSPAPYSVVTRPRRALKLDDGEK